MVSHGAKVARITPDKRGNNKDRARRKQWLLETFGDGESCACRWCGERLTFETITADRFPLCGHDGGRYTRDNVVPSCGPCNFGRCSGHTKKGGYRGDVQDFQS